jgi:ribosome-associated translation inhibitor RaiA
MTFPIAVAFHGIEPSDALRRDVLARAQGLERLLGDIIACRVVIEATSRRLPHSRYGVHIRLAMPCIEIDAGGNPTSGFLQDDPHLTVAEAFDVLTCRLENFVCRRCVSCARYRETRSDR